MAAAHQPTVMKHMNTSQHKCLLRTQAADINQMYNTLKRRYFYTKQEKQILLTVVEPRA